MLSVGMVSANKANSTHGVLPRLSGNTDDVLLSLSDFAHVAGAACVRCSLIVGWPTASAYEIDPHDESPENLP